MIQKQISTENANDGQLRLLYETAFPKEEQIPWDDLVRLINEMHLDFTAYYDGEEFIGFTIVYPRPSFNWYWHFAVKEELRGKGLGQQILNQLIKNIRGSHVFWIWSRHVRSVQTRSKGCVAKPFIFVTDSVTLMSIVVGMTWR